MANAAKVGRNDRCPCGSGKKFKACCELKKNQLSRGTWIAIAVLVAAAALAVAFAYNASQGEGRPSSSRACPPGQTWSAQHGHCH